MRNILIGTVHYIVFPKKGHRFTAGGPVDGKLIKTFAISSFPLEEEYTSRLIMLIQKYILLPSQRLAPPALPGSSLSFPFP